jgi:hypothetical protein
VAWLKVDFKVGFKVILVSETCSPQGGLRRMDTKHPDAIDCVLREHAASLGLTRGY